MGGKEAFNCQHQHSCYNFPFGLAVKGGGGEIPLVLVPPLSTFGALPPDGGSGTLSTLPFCHLGYMLHNKCLHVMLIFIAEADEAWCCGSTVCIKKKGNGYAAVLEAHKLLQITAQCWTLFSKVLLY